MTPLCRTLQGVLGLSLLGAPLAQAAPVQTLAPTYAQFRLPAPVHSAQPDAPLTAERRAALTRGRQLLGEFYAVRLDALWQAFTPAVKAQWGSLAAFKTFRQTGVQQYGAQRDLVRERTFTDSGVTYYVRSATFEKSPQQVWLLIIGFRPGGSVSAFNILLEEDRTGNPQA